MNTLLIIAFPLGLVILGMILNSFDLGFDQPPSSPEQDPLQRLTAEKGKHDEPRRECCRAGRGVRWRCELLRDSEVRNRRGY